MRLLPKLCGADIELGNFILGVEQPAGTGSVAARALLREIYGMPNSGVSLEFKSRKGSQAWPNNGDGMHAADGRDHLSQDWGRKFLPCNGGCVYIDLDHLELCLPEVVSAYDHVACWHAMLRIARRALRAANQRLPEGCKIQLLVNNSDGFGNSYGSHLNLLIARQTWENIFNRKLQYMLYLAAYQVSSIVFTGQGKVGSENGMPEVDFQIAQRADFFEQLTGLQTTFKRPLVNSRDEPHCGPRRTFSDAGSPAEEMARLHVIFFDNTLCHVASLLKVGVTQMILSMIEQERMNPSLLLDDPLNAVVLWSHDPSLQARARMASGQELTAVELQFLFLEEASRFMSSGKCGDVPNAADILSMWEDTLLKLRAGDFTALARRLDWVLKLSLLRRTLAKRPDLAWSSPQIKHLDHLYSSLDPAEGLFWAYDRNGFHERVVNEERIEWFVNNPPEDTRAWTRAMILRRAQRGTVDAVDWDSIRIRTRTSGGWSRYTEVELSDPLGFTKTASAQAFGETKLLEEILEGLAGGYASDSSTSSTN